MAAGFDRGALLDLAVGVDQDRRLQAAVGDHQPAVFGRRHPRRFLELETPRRVATGGGPQHGPREWAHQPPMDQAQQADSSAAIGRGRSRETFFRCQTLQHFRCRDPFAAAGQGGRQQQARASGRRAWGFVFDRRQEIRDRALIVAELQAELAGADPGADTGLEIGVAFPTVEQGHATERRPGFFQVGQPAGLLDFDFGLFDERRRRFEGPVRNLSVAGRAPAEWPGGFPGHAGSRRPATELWALADPAGIAAPGAGARRGPPRRPPIAPVAELRRRDARPPDLEPTPASTRS